MNRTTAYVTATLLLSVPTVALAQAPAPLPPEAFAKAEAPAPTADASEANITAGGAYATGNSKSASLNAGASARVRRGDHQGKFKADLALGYSAVPTADQAARDAKLERSAENYALEARYDYFFTDYVSGFVQARAFHDYFQSLDLRLDLAPGISLYVVAEKSEQLQVDIGYDYQRDFTRNAPDVTFHNSLLGVSYHNAVNSAVVFDSGIYYLQAFSPFKTDDTINMRLEGFAALNAKVSDKFSVTTSLAVKYNNNPSLVAGSNTVQMERTDAITKLALVYNLL